ncbi:putative transcription factor PosF21 [Artemisia annua]|uniref:Putative transcription factor PosF21 n=1 Tax=Artemisia annua TaxID=35608 RepID=A0A2U1KNA1_ARTAN|nr:putative transcription factor PosF21 [Artemisia annua]
MSATDHAKKSISADKLAELSIIDPKRAKRIRANRQSTTLSMERKMRYITELERKVQTLQTEATYMHVGSADPLQKDVHGLTAINNELKLRLQTMEQQGYMQHYLLIMIYDVTDMATNGYCIKNYGVADKITHKNVAEDVTYKNVADVAFDKSC